MSTLMWTGCFRPILLKKSAMVSTAESTRLRLKSLLPAENFELKFRIATRKKVFFSSQYAVDPKDRLFQHNRRKLSWPLRVIFASRPFLIDQREDRGLPILVVMFVVSQ